MLRRTEAMLAVVATLTLGSSVGALTLSDGTMPVGASTTCSYVTNNCDPKTHYTETTNVPIKMSDGTILESDVYVPTTCTATTRCPVVLIQTPYRKGDDSTSPDDLTGIMSSEAQPDLYEHGYIEVVVDVRGTGSSEGYWDALGPREQQDSAEIVQWVANPANIAQSDGVVGLAGASYSAINQLLTVEAINDDIAGHGPLTDQESGCKNTATFDCGNPTDITSDPVKAITPEFAGADFYRDIVFAGGNGDSGFMPLWLAAVNEGNDEPPDVTLSAPTVALNTETQHIEDIATFDGPLVAGVLLGSYESESPFAQSEPDVAYDSAFYTERSPITNIGAIDVPTLLIGGTYDLFQRGEPILYNGLNLPPTDKKLMIGPYYHGPYAVPPSEIPSIDVAGNIVVYPERGWFDHWLKGQDNGVQGFPTVETYELGAHQWIPGTQYPAPSTTGQRWFLGDDGTLSTRPSSWSGSRDLPTVTATGTCSRSTWQWTGGQTYLIQPGPLSVCENNSTISEIQGLTFTTAPFTKPYTVSGPMEADVYMSSTAADSSVIATVSDVTSSGPGGTTVASDVTAGTLVASFRAVTQAPCQRIVLDCSVYLNGQSIEPWHPYTPSSQAALQPGKVYELQIEIFPTSETFEPGHQMRVTITTSDIPHETQTLSTTAHSLGIDTFYFGADTPSSLYLGTTTPLAGAAG